MSKQATVRLGKCEIQELLAALDILECDTPDDFKRHEKMDDITQKLLLAATKAGIKL